MRAGSAGHDAGAREDQVTIQGLPARIWCLNVACFQIGKQAWIRKPLNAGEKEKEKEKGFGRLATVVTIVPIG